MSSGDPALSTKRPMRAGDGSSRATTVPAAPSRLRSLDLIGTRSGRALLTALTLLAGLVVWQLAVVALDLEPYILPAPGDVLNALVDAIAEDGLVKHTYTTAGEIVVGFVAGSILGVAIGAMIALSRWLELIFYPYVMAFNAVPKVAITPLIIVWFGTGFNSIVLVSALFSFFPVLVNVVVGARSVDREQLSYMGSLTATRWQTFRMVRIPAALPSLFAGLQIAIVLAVSGAIVGEFIGAKAGLGYYILLANSLLDTTAMFAAFLVLGALGALLSWAIGRLARRVVFWRQIDPGGVG